MSTNYLPWGVAVDSFFEEKTLEDRLRFLLKFAVLAPSSHNSQPWQFRVAGRTIEVYADDRKRLLESDPTNRQMFISLGCAVTNILVAGDYYGLNGDTEYSPRAAHSVPCATISFTESVSRRASEHLVFSILTRATNRNAYDDRMPPDDFLKSLQALGGGDLRVDVITEKHQKEVLADAALAGIAEAMANNKFREELSHYIKPNTTTSPFGMPGFGIGFPTIVSFVAPTLLKYVNMNKMSHAQEEALLKSSTPVLTVISTPTDGETDWLKAGQTYEKIALMAEQAGIKTAVWAAPVEIGEHHKTLQRVLGTDFRPQVFFRMGYTQKITPHSPRLASEQVLITRATNQ